MLMRDLDKMEEDEDEEDKEGGAPISHRNDKAVLGKS
jgi:hypothetical protein